MSNWKLYVLTIVAATSGAPGSLIAAGDEYTYVGMPMAMPWIMYFIFLSLILIPFAVMIWYAWRSHARRKDGD